MRKHLICLLFLAIFCFFCGFDVLSQSKKITLVARECKNYSDVMANKARNNIMESLKDLGPNSSYQSGEAVSVQKEEAIATQVNNCIALNNWKFTIGDSINSTKDTGIFGELSKVKTTVRVSPETQADVDQLNANGQAIGVKIDGAITLDLSSAEENLLSKGRLTVQGGRPGDPLLNSQVLGFATLRCGTDNQNADNVEYARYPSQAKHIFCYAYYINPAPTAAQIIIKKVIEGSPPLDSNPNFNFTGNVSFNPGGTFSLKAGESITFDRAGLTPGDTAWTVSEDTTNLASGYTFKNVTCTTDGNSGSTTSVSSNKVTIALRSGDKVSCVYTNRYTPPPSTANISPIVDCTSRSGTNQFRGHFGYFNREGTTISIPPSSNNMFSPAPSNRGQPFTFLDGRHSKVFSVDHDSSNLVWKLATRTATSSDASSQRCLPSCVVPQVEALDQCDPNFIIDGSNSSTLNNGGRFSSFVWSTTCDGSLIDTDTLTPTLVLDLADRSKDLEKCKVTLTVTDDTQYGTNNPAEIHSASCSTEISVPNCATDCAGIPNGNTAVDECGICGGDNSTCKDCAGIANGSNIIDRCGVCGGDNSTCSDCAGVPNGSTTVDSCGICGGNGSSCSGVCDESDLDACGVCNGNSSTCLDCAGIANGSTNFDECGVCGGDGLSCTQCTAIDTPQENSRDEGQIIVKNLNALFKVATRYSKEAVKCSPSSIREIQSDFKNITKLAELIEDEISQSYVNIENVCGNQICSSAETSAVKKDLKALVNSIRNLIVKDKKIVATCRRPIEDATKKRGSREIAIDIKNAIDSLPSIITNCSN